MDEAHEPAVKNQLREFTLKACFLKRVVVMLSEPFLPLPFLPAFCLIFTTVGSSSSRGLRLEAMKILQQVQAYSFFGLALHGMGASGPGGLQARIFCKVSATFSLSPQEEPPQAAHQLQRAG